MDLVVAPAGCFSNCRERHAVPALRRLAVSFPAAFACGGVCSQCGDGALVDDLHAGAPVFSAPPAAAGGRTGNENVTPSTNTISEQSKQKQEVLSPVSAALPPLPLSSPPSISSPPSLLLPPLPPLLPALAAARPPGGILVVAVQVAALVLPLPSRFVSVVGVAAFAGGERGRWRRLRGRLWGGAQG